MILPPSTRSLDEVVARVLRQPAPLLVYDACAALDILRLPSKDSKLGAAHARQYVTDLIDAAGRQPPLLHLVAPHGVWHEWSRNWAEVEKGVARELKAADKARERAFELAGRVNDIRQLATTLDMAGALRTLALAMLDLTVFVAPDALCLMRALERSEQERAPASRSKEERRDCEHVEHALQLLRLLKVGGFDKVAHFVSSNSADFGKTDAPSPPLDVEFAEVGLSFANDLLVARRRLLPATRLA